MTDPHCNCYTAFDIVEGRDLQGNQKVILVGYWTHSDGQDGVDELADFLASEYPDEALLRAKAYFIKDLLTDGLRLRLH